jgi:cytochrome c553
VRLGLPSALRRRREGPPEGLVPTTEAVARARRTAAAPAPLDDRQRELLAQRERLTERFALLQTDLGGAFYEMAIRDHVQLDVLTRKAAELQRVDAELEAVEAALRPAEAAVPPPAAGACAHCHAPFDDSARFCSSCGAGLLALSPLPPPANGAPEHHVNGTGG